MPRQNSGNQYDAWCQQLGGTFDSVTYGQRLGRSVFGCTSYDDVGNWHWCDYNDGYWYNRALDMSEASYSDFITSITC